MESILQFLPNNPEPLNRNGETPLDLASRGGNYQIIREVYEDLDILSPETEMDNMKAYENFNTVGMNIPLQRWGLVRK